MFKIFVGNLPPTATADAIRSLFARHVDVEDVALAIDPESNKPRGFAIVMIRDEQQGKVAIQSLRGARLNGRALVINPARKKKKGSEPAERTPREPRGRSAHGFSGRRGASSSSSAGRGYAPRPRSFGGGRPSRPTDRPERGLGGPSASS